MSTKIRHCPHCTQLVHFEPQRTIQRCWNCAHASDFSTVLAPDEKLAWWLGSRLERITPDFSRLAKVGRIALVLAVPATVTMLLICNSFDVFIVLDAAAPFFSP